jgi:hypothetical protein
VASSPPGVPRSAVNGRLRICCVAGHRGTSGLPEKVERWPEPRIRVPPRLRPHPAPSPSSQLGAAARMSSGSAQPTTAAGAQNSVVPNAYALQQPQDTKQTRLDLQAARQAKANQLLANTRESGRRWAGELEAARKVEAARIAPQTSPRSTSPTRGRTSTPVVQQQQSRGPSPAR